MAGGTWSEERIEALRSLWGQGLSARTIGDRLGGLSRNTVMGKLDRLGLLGTRNANDKPPPQKAGSGEPPSPRGATRATPIPAPLPAPDDVLEIQARTAETATASSPPARPVAIEAPEASEPMTLQELKTSSCRWPLGHPGSSGFGFCGGRAIAGRPYCEGHAKLAYEPPRERRRA